MKTIKLYFITALDWFDDTILRHRFYFLCQFIGNHLSWYNEEPASARNDAEQDLLNPPEEE
jgi:hypothetical protein